MNNLPPLRIGLGDEVKIILKSGEHVAAKVIGFEDGRRRRIPFNDWRICVKFGDCVKGTDGTAWYGQQCLLDWMKVPVSAGA